MEDVYMLYHMRKRLLLYYMNFRAAPAGVNDYHSV